MMTYEKYRGRTAFDTADAREAFFAARRGTSQPAVTSPGTAVAHVLATNVGIWGDRQALKRDAAEIMACELDTFARESGADTLGLPGSAILNSPTFGRLVEAAAGVNANEIDAFARSGFKDVAEEPLPAVVADAMADPAAVLLWLYEELCPVADNYKRLTSNYREDLAIARIT